MKFKIVIALILVIVAISTIFFLQFDQIQNILGLHPTPSESSPPIEDVDLAELIIGYSYDGTFECDLNGDGETEQVIFFTGQNQTDFDAGKIPTGWDLGAHSIVEGKSHIVWFNTEGSTSSLQMHTFDDGRQGIVLVVPNNIDEETFLLFYEDNMLKFIPLQN